MIPVSVQHRIIVGAGHAREHTLSRAWPAPTGCLKSNKRSAKRESGFILLPVILAMTLIAAIAFLINRDNGMNANMVTQQVDADRARYAAEAGLQAVNAKIQSLGCGATTYPIVTSPLVNNNFGGASYSAYASAASGNTANLTAIGTFNGASVRLVRSNVYVYQTPRTFTLQPDAVTGMDTFITNGSAANNGGAKTFSGGSNNFPLLKFDLSPFPLGSVPLSTTLSLSVTGGGIGGLSQLHRMTTAWQEGTGAADGANWATRNGVTNWTTPGGDFNPTSVDAVLFAGGSGWVSFNQVNDIAAAWLSGRYPNHGVILKSVWLGSPNFSSSDEPAAIYRPKLVFNYLAPCGTVGPVDPPPTTTVTLNPTADSFNDSGLVQANNGAATTLKAYYTPIRENRILTKFDTSAIPTTSTVQRATLRMFVSGVTSATANPKSIWANAVNEVWAEGAGNNTSKVCPITPSASTSWNYRTNCTNWANTLHPPNTPQAWSTMTQMPTARTSHMVASVNNKIYAIGGLSTSGSYLKVVEEYNPATNTWATKAAMTTARANAAVAVVNGKIYVIGGTSGSPLDKNEEYDPATNTWTSKRALPTARRYLSAATANNKIYAIGGATNTTAVKTNEEYDPVADTWASKANMPTARTYLSVQGVNGKVYAIGGYSGVLSLANNEVYDPIANSWATKAALLIGTDSMSSAVLGNKIYLISGYQGVLISNKVWMYDTVNNTYVAQPNYTTAANEPAAAAANNKIYSMGGDNGTGGAGASKNHYQYDPGITVPAATAFDEATLASPLVAGFTGGWIDFDITTLAQGWVTTPTVNNGVVIYSETADQLSVNSREANNKTPQLIVTYY